MKMLKTKHFRRLAVFLAMIAPAVYLFGSLFAGLSGANGLPVYATSDDVVDMQRIDFNQRFSLPSQSTSIYFNKVDDITLEFVGSADANIADVLCFNVTSALGHQVYFKMESSQELSTSSSYFVYWSNAAGSVYDGISLTRNYFYGVYNSETSIFIRVYPSSNVGAVIKFNFFDLTQMYGEGNEPTKEEFDLQYPDFYNPVSSSIIYRPVYGDGSYSDSIFNRFFNENNFLVQWGMNAISDEPKGFAPFGAFWRYLDMNVLHLSNDQMGLMGYGYMYYACHVLLFDVGFILVTFFLDFIQRIADKFTGGE